MPRAPAVTCPVPSCHRTRAAGMVMCRMHWRRVAPALRAELHAAWREYREVRGEAHWQTEGEVKWLAYREVRERAILEAA